MKRRIVFLAVNASYAHSSLAAWCLQAAADGCGWEWHTIETTIKDDPDLMLDRIGLLRPDALAATLYLFNRASVLALLRRYRALNPACRIIVGGPECLGDNRRLIGAQAADVAVRGEGEMALRQWMESFDTPGRWPAIPGLCGLHEGHYFDAGTADAVTSLDAIPPYYARVFAGGFRKPFVQVETSRGCSNGCLFCTSRRSRRRTKSIERLRLDLEEVRRAGISEVRIVDRTFNEHTPQALERLQLFRGEFSDIRFHLEIDPARVTDDLAKELAMAPGQYHVEAGVQSLEQDVYATIERSGTVQRTREGLARLCALRGLQTHVDLIAGLPGSTLEQVLADIRDVIALGPSEIQLERLKLLPGTPLAEASVQWGIEAEDVPPYRVLRTTHISESELARVDRWSRLLDWFYNVPALRAVLAEAVRGNPAFIPDFETHLTQNNAFSECLSLEDRFRVLARFLKSGDGDLCHDLAYQWLKCGFSARNGLAPAQPWKKPLPTEAVLEWGSPGMAVDRIWRVELGVPHFFCYGTGPNGARTVVAVYSHQNSCGSCGSIPLPS